MSFFNNLSLEIAYFLFSAPMLKHHLGSRHIIAIQKRHETYYRSEKKNDKHTIFHLQSVSYRYVEIYGSVYKLAYLFPSFCMSNMIVIKIEGAVSILKHKCEPASDSKLTYYNISRAIHLFNSFQKSTLPNYQYKQGISKGGVHYQLRFPSKPYSCKRVLQTHTYKSSYQNMASIFSCKQRYMLIIVFLQKDGVLFYFTYKLAVLPTFMKSLPLPCPNSSCSPTCTSKDGTFILVQTSYNKRRASCESLTHLLIKNVNILKFRLN